MVGEVYFRKRHGEGVVFVLRVLARIQYEDGKVVGIFMRKRIVCLVHRTPELSILSPSIGKLNDNRHPIRSRHRNPILFQETRWSIAGGEEDIESAKRENSEVEQVRGDIPFSELCQLGVLKEFIQSNTCVAHCEQLSMHYSTMRSILGWF